MKLNFNFNLLCGGIVMEKTSYKTRQRAQILDFLRENAERSMTVDEIVRELGKHDCVVGRTTVYRFLDSLTEQGEVRRFLREGEKSAAFQFVGDHNECAEHIHLRCKRCGKFVHLGCGFMKGANEHLFRSHGFCVDNEKTVLVGVCADCLKGDEENGAD